MNYKNLQKNQQSSFNLSFRVIILGIFMLVIGGEFVSAQADPDVENYNYVLGTQTIGADYRFTTEDALLETSKAIYAMGSRTLKISLDVNKYIGVTGSNSPVVSLARDNASFREALDMPFRNYFMWTRGNTLWADGYSETERATDSIEIYDLTKHLLSRYNNTGKTFYLGHWEGDWYLLQNYDLNYVPSDARCANMAKWLRTRQNAIDKAKSEGGFSNVMVYGYVEVNRVPDAMDYGKKRVVNTVLPFTNVDFVSYSSYDAQRFGQARYNSVLNYIESKLPPKAGIPGKRVFIGEVGRSFRDSGDIIKHESDNRALFKTAIAWGCPFVLYWEMYNNETDADGQIGFWLINDKNEKQPLYYTFTSFYEAAKQYVANFKLTNTRVPNSTEYAVWASNYLTTKPNTFGQTTYVGAPTTAANTTCPNGNVTSGPSGTCTSPTTFIGNTIKAYVGSISGTIATVNLVRCDGTAFGTGTYFLKNDDVCGTVISSGAVSGTNVPITISLNHTGIKNYRITFSSWNGSKYYTNNFSITGACRSTNIVNQRLITFSNIQTTQATATWPSLPGAIGYRINYITCAGTTFSFQDLPTSTNSYTLTGLAANTSYKIQIRAVFPDNCFGIWNGASDCFTTLSLPNSVLKERIDYSKSPSTVQGLLTTDEDPIQNNTDVKIRGNKQMIILENDKTSGQVDVYSTDGRLVHSSKLLSDERKDISLPAGVYIIRIEKNNLISTHKIIL